MPHYDYSCSHCGHKAVIFQKMTESSITQCSACQQPTLKRGPGGGIGISFQGSGFYVTDSDSNRESNSQSTAKGSCCPCNKSSCSS